MSEFLDLRSAIERHVHDGQTIALEGFTHLIPFAAGQEVIRQRRRDLTVVRMTPDVIYDQLIGAGCVHKLVFSWGGNPGVGSLHPMREAIQELVAQERYDMASVLADAGMAIHPASEDVIAIAALVAMVRQDWVQAIELLTKLMLVQDGAVQPFTHLMLVRALRSNLEPAAALQATVTGLIQYPDHAELLAEQVALFELAGMAHPGAIAD